MTDQGREQAMEDVFFWAAGAHEAQFTVKVDKRQYPRDTGGSRYLAANTPLDLAYDEARGALVVERRWIGPLAMLPPEAVEHVLDSTPQGLRPKDLWTASVVFTWEDQDEIVIRVRRFAQGACGCVKNFGGWPVRPCPEHRTPEPRWPEREGFGDEWTGDPRVEQERIHRGIS